MRPSDVPTYVEHGSADIGITGKDVLLEQSQRKVYELLDLGYGRCRMVVAAREGGDPIGDALRRLGRVRIATKYPRVAARALRRHRPPGRDRGGEGLGGAGAADRPGGRHRRPDRHRARRCAENDLRVVEEIGVCTARLIANPVSHKLKAGQIDRLVREDSRVRISRARNAWCAPAPGARGRARGGRDHRRGPRAAATTLC